MILTSRPSYDAMKRRLLEDLKGVKNIRDCKYARKRLQQYRRDARGLHVAVRQVNDIPYYLERVVILL